MIYQSLEPDGANSIGGLVNVNEYKVKFLSADTIQLLDPTTGQSLRSQTQEQLRRNRRLGPDLQFRSGDRRDGGTGSIYLPGDHLQTGDVVSYQVDPTLSTTLTTQTQIPDPNNPGQFIGVRT